MPLMRAMWLHYPDDTRVRGLGTQFMWGRDLLIAPVFKKGATSRVVYLPKGDWYDWWTNSRSTGERTVTREVDLATMPIYVRAGAIVPFDPVRQYTGEKVTDPTTLKIYSGADGEYTLYEDDGISQDYMKGNRHLDADGVERSHQAAHHRTRRPKGCDQRGGQTAVQTVAASGRFAEGSNVRREADPGDVLRAGLHTDDIGQ